MIGGTVIIGLGNPLLADDGVGIAVARGVGRTLGGRLPLTVRELHTGGLRLMEAMAGFRRAVVIDAMVSGAPPGTVHPFHSADFVTSKNTFSSHDTDFATACELGRLVGLALPERIAFWGVEARSVDLFGESFSAEVTAALPVAIEAIAAQLLQWEAAA